MQNYIHEIEFFLFIAGKMAAGFGLVVVMFQIFGTRRQLTQITTIDLISNFVLCGIIGGYLYSDNVSFFRFLIVIVNYFLIMFILNKLRDHTHLGRKLIVGIPTVIINNGRVDREAMKKAKLSMTDLMSLLRQHDIHTLKEVKVAQVEVGGDITVVKRGEENFALMLVDNGVVDDDNLERIGRDEVWLEQELKKKGIEDMNEVYCAQWSGGKVDVMKC